MKAASTPPPGLWQVVGVLAAYLLIRHAAALTAPFFSDDYLFLDKLAGAPFATVWSADRLAYHWYRPWSRELHYWTFFRLFGLDVLPFHVASFALWLAAMSLYWLLVRRAASATVATLACCGVTALAAWGVLLEWAPGVQDLWMMVLALAALLAFASRRSALASVSLALALLSKETAATVPVIGFAWALAIDRERAGAALRRIAPLLAVVVAWASVHPALGGRLWWGRGLEPLPSVRTAPLVSALRTLLAMVNLDLAPRPLGGWTAALLAALPGAILLALLAALAFGARARSASVEREDTLPVEADASAAVPPTRRAALAAAWALAGFLPLLMPSVLWQPYYAMFGALGAWIAIAEVLARSRPVAIAAVAALALASVVRSDTATRDWGNEWTQRFGKTFMSQTERDLRTRFPEMPRHARFWFTGVPRGVVFIVGRNDCPALRVWFHDAMVSGGYWSDYRRRAANEPDGPDYFFRWDSTRWTQVIPGAEPLDSLRGRDPHWRENHERLAWVLLNADDVRGAAAEYEKLARHHPLAFDYAYLAGMTHEAIGDSNGARRWYALAAERPGADTQALARLKTFGASR